MRKYFAAILIALVLSSVSASSRKNTPVPAPKPLVGKVVALDAGHGGDDPGAVNQTHSSSPLLEKDVDRKVVRTLKRKLEKNGARVVLTRPRDESVSLPDRVDRANQAGAQVLISIHHNSADPSVNGTETYFTQPADKALAEAVQSRLTNGLGLRDGGVRHSPDFVMTNRPNMPSTIAESSFISNDAEADELRHGERVEEEATALNKGVIDYFNQKG